MNRGVCSSGGKENVEKEGGAGAAGSTNIGIKHKPQSDKAKEKPKKPRNNNIL